jgi:hypothetical protein
LRGSPQEKCTADLLTDLLTALRREQLTLAGGEKETERARDAIQLYLWESDRLGSWEKWCRAHNIRSLRLSRDEFLGWVERQGLSRPTFWDGTEEGYIEQGRGNEPPTTSTSIKAATTSPSGLDAWVQAQIKAGKVPGKTIGFSWKEAERQAKAAFPQLRGTSGRNLKRLFNR